MGHWQAASRESEWGKEQTKAQRVKWGHWNTRTALLYGVDVSVSLWFLSKLNYLYA